MMIRIAAGAVHHQQLTVPHGPMGHPCMMKMTWTVRVSSVAAPSHGASGAQGRQHEMLRLQEEGYFLSSFILCASRPHVSASLAS